MLLPSSEFSKHLVNICSMNDLRGMEENNNKIFLWFSSVQLMTFPTRLQMPKFKKKKEKPKQKILLTNLNKKSYLHSQFSESIFIQLAGCPQESLIFKIVTF